jgi:hypothetical protein
MTKSAKAPVRPAFQTRTALPANLPEHFLLVRQANAGKLGLRAHGHIVYQTLLDPERRRVFLRVVTNSGSGSFSDEPVHVDKLAQAVASRDLAKPLRGSALQGAIVGKSVCNAGFFAAVLVAESLLGRDPAKRFDLLDLERWQTWTAEQLATPGELTQVRLKWDATDQKNDKLAAASKTCKGKWPDAGLAEDAGETGETGTDQAAADVTDSASDAGAHTPPDEDTHAEATSSAEEGAGHPEVDPGEGASHKGRRRGKGKE